MKSAILAAIATSAYANPIVLGWPAKEGQPCFPLQVCEGDSLACIADNGNYDNFGKCRAVAGLGQACVGRYDTTQPLRKPCQERYLCRNGVCGKRY